MRGGYVRCKERRGGAAVLLMRGVWLGGAALDALATVSRLRGAALEEQAPIA